MDDILYTTDIDEVSVLVVDDEPHILNSLKRLFRGEPFCIHSATTGEDGLKILSNLKNVGLIISDQRMPGMNGADFLHRSLEVAPDAIRMLLTGYADIHDTVTAMNEGGATRYIAKPWQDTELLQIVREAIVRYRLQQEVNHQHTVIKTQNEELQSWNSNLKERVLAQTAKICNQLDELQQISRQQEDKYYGVIAALAALIDLRDQKSRLHATNTAALSVSIATRLGLSKVEVETVRTAALLHDIGKNAMSDVALACREEDMNDDDRQQFYEHPVLAQTAIDTIEDLRPAGILIRHHHENFDGNGFPDGLAGEAIPRGAAIITLADRCDREMNFHSGINAVEQALEKLAEQVGTCFAPQLFPYLNQAAYDLYDSRHKNIADAYVERTIHPDKLRAGMILTRDLFSASGLFLLGGGNELSHDTIRSLQRNFVLDPHKGGIHVGIRNI
jgi:putative nucleotidyltransferase with HDIG domain